MNNLTKKSFTQLLKKTRITPICSEFKVIEPAHDNRKMRLALDYLCNLNTRYFNLCLTMCTVPYAKQEFTKPDGRITLAYYTKSWKSSQFYDGKNRFGMITFNMESISTMPDEDICELVRHELAHAIVDIKLKCDHESCCGHGRTWRRVAKLLRVKTERYSHIN